MKQDKLSLSRFAEKLQEQDGKLNGGFAVLLPAENAAVLGGEETNNCNGGNCVTGCGTNSVAGCGGQVNNVAGCGKATEAYSFA
ncbi:MAG TPA: hypothetical protein VD996_03705 [Chitinophagaceae bacterium]|nr:hypothetical protein [Chitinophagaceae bacterium]